MVILSEILEVLRSEHKYSLSTYQAEVLRLRLSRILPSDSHNIGKDGYLVRSLYFDSFYNNDFFEKDGGIEFRKKIRLRTYGDGNIFKLETKQKQGNLQRKLSVKVSRTEAEALINSDYAFLLARSDELPAKFYAEMMTKHYEPKCVIDYNRFAYVVPANDTRITFDSNISGNECNFDIINSAISMFPVLPLGNTTLEVKYNNFLLSYVKQALSIDGNYIECASSKYCAVRKYSLGGIT